MHIIIDIFYALSFETHGNDEKCQMTQIDVAIVILEYSLNPILGFDFN